MGKPFALVTRPRAGSTLGHGGLGSLGAAADNPAPPITWSGVAQAAEIADEVNPVTALIEGLKSTAAMLTNTAISGVSAADRIMQTFDGSGSISASDFKAVGTACKPMNVIALGFAVNLQNQMNRVAKVKGFGKVAPDGAIGPGTLALLKKIQAANPQILGNTTACIWIAADADVIGDQVKQYADALGAPATVSHPAGQAASIVTKSGLTVTIPQAGASASVLDAFGGMSGTQKVVFGGLLGGIGYVLYKKSTKKGRK